MASIKLKKKQTIYTSWISFSIEYIDFHITNTLIRPKGIVK